jgi:hypothetical protein
VQSCLGSCCQLTAWWEPTTSTRTALFADRQRRWLGVGESRLNVCIISRGHSITKFENLSVRADALNFAAAESSQWWYPHMPILNRPFQLLPVRSVQDKLWSCKVLLVSFSPIRWKIYWKQSNIVLLHLAYSQVLVLCFPPNIYELERCYF